MRKIYTPAFVTLIVLLLFTNFLWAQTEVKLTSGSGYWKPPVGVTSFYVQCWGGGAGGNGAAGGSGGSFSQSTTYTVSSYYATNGYYYSVGAGGAYNEDGVDTKFESCWAYRGLKGNVTSYKYNAGGQIAKSYFGGYGGWRWDGSIWYPEVRYGGGGGSGYTDKNGGNGSSASGGTNGSGGGGTGNGGNAGSNGSAPGGGGAGNKAGARGEIRIYYTCNGSPGSIGNAHTVPSPRELSPDNISNTALPLNYAFNYKWQSSPNNATWTDITNNATSYAFPAISSDTYFRRVITNSCATATANIATAPVLIKVFSQANGKLNGTISGRVVSNNGIGVQGITISAQKTVSLRGSPSSKIYTAVTNSTGDYTISNIFYGDLTNGDPSSVQFNLTPSKAGHTFSTRDPVTLTNINFSSSGNNFTDNTVYAITGQAYQNCADCITAGGATGSVNVGLGGATLSISDGVVSAYTDSLNAATLGNFATTVPDPKNYTFTPSYGNHTFSPVTRVVAVTNNVSNVLFEDVTKRTISGKLTDAAGLYIGTGSLLFTGTYVTKDGLPIQTFRKRVSIAAGTGAFSVTLPARNYYSVIVESFTSAFPSSDDRYITAAALTDFFNNRAKEPPMNIDQANVIRNLVYHRPPVIILTGLADTTCNATRVPPLGIVFRQNIPKQFQVNVFEGPQSLNYRVVPTDSSLVGAGVTDTLRDYVRFFTDVTDITGSAPPDTLYFRLKNRQTRPMIESAFMPGAPNITAPFAKTFELYYIDKYGRSATMIRRDAVVTGIQQPPATFITASPEKPYLILHEPPGDASYSYWSQTKSVETSSKFAVASADGENGFVEVNAGANFSAGIGVQIETEAVASISTGFSRTATNTAENETILRTSTTTTFETVKSGSLIKGSSGDVYIGAAINYKLGAANTVKFKTGLAPNACELEFDRQLIIAPDSFKTEFAYAEDHIINVIIPQNQTLADQETNPSKKSRFLNQISVWQQVISNNNLQKRNAKFIINRSFSSGLKFDESQTSSKTSVNTLTYEMEIDKDVATELGIEVNGIGVTGGATVTFKEVQGETSTTNRTQETTIGYHLEDNDPGDYYSVDIKTDPVYGTPVFDLVAGTSSCPAEPGAQSRDLPVILRTTPVFDNLDAGNALFFTLKLSNKSESGEDRQYLLSVNGNTNDGLLISSSGSNNLVSDPLLQTVPFAGTKDVTIKVQKFNATDKILSYPDVEFVLTDNCGGSESGSTTISFNYASACGGITLAAPMNGWKINGTSGNTLPVTLTGYTLSSVDSITLLYEKTGTNVWKNGFTLKQGDITDPTTFTHPWNIASLTDSAYNIRLRLVCLNGSVILTPAVAGLVDRKPPSLVGKPQPASGLYAPGSSEISFTYHENIDISDLNNGKVTLVRLSDQSIIPVSVIGIDNKIIINPLNSLGNELDSFRVIVKNISDTAQNVKPIPDTSFFKLDLTPLITYNGSNVATVHVVTPSMLENASGKMELHFRLRENTGKISKIYFNVSGNALFNTDYEISYDTVIQKKCANIACNSFIYTPVYNQFMGSPGYVYIDSNKTEAILYIDPIDDNEFEPDETIRVNLTTGGDYKIIDSVLAIATIKNDELAPPFIVSNGPLSFCEGDSVTLSVLTQKYRYATSVKGFSTQYNTSDFAAVQALGAPDVFPAYGDLEKTWASLTQDGSREYLTLGFDEASPINYIDIYETYKPGAVDTVYVKNPGTGMYEIVYTATAAAQPDVSRKLRIFFPVTGFPVSEIRIAINSPAVPDWNEIDAVGIGLTTGYASYVWSPGGATTSSLTVKTSGTYRLTASDGFGSSATSNPITVTVAPGGTTVNAGVDMTGICPGVPTSVLNGSFGGNATGAIWSDEGAGGTFTNNTGSTPNTATYIPAANANGMISLKLTAIGNGCLATATKMVFVNGVSTWLGITSDWNEDANWSNGVKPLGCTKVTIPNGLPFLPTISGANNTCYSLKLEPGATINVAPGAVLVITGTN